MKNFILVTTLSLVYFLSSAQKFESKFTSEHLEKAPVKLIPFPQEITWEGGERLLKNIWIANYNKTSKRLKDELYDICTANGIELNPTSDYTIKFLTNEQIEEEGYWLTVSEETLTITASSEKGHYYGLKTLRQLIKSEGEDNFIHLCDIKDKPAFSIRGYMIDVGRNFQSIKAIKKQLDIMADYKMNVFHWHLTDHPAWRIESKIYPQLNDPIHHNATRDPGMFYTFDEIRDVIKYAKQRNIWVLPEIDVPGHSAYFLKAFGFKMESEKGMLALEALFNEFFNEIPKEMAPVIHLGSDEVSIPNPKEFVSKMVSFVEDDGREAVAWHPGLDAKKSVIRQNWGGNKLLPASGIREIDSDFNYINVGEPMSHIPSIFLRPIGKGSNNETLGGIICLWPDVNIKREDDIITQNPLYSSLVTYAWATWTADVLSSPDKYLLQIPKVNTEAFNYFKAFESYLLDHKERFFKNEPFQYIRQTDKPWKLIGPFKNDDGDKIINHQDNKSYRYEGKKISWNYVTGNSFILNHSWKKNEYYPKMDAGNVMYALTYIHSNSEKEVPVWISFDAPSRNYKGQQGVAENGSFDGRGSTIWVNDEKISGPVWDSPIDTSLDVWVMHEIPWTKEELYWTRKPTLIHLKKGVNKVFIKIPKTHKKQEWMFTFAVLETEGLIFKSDK